MKDYIPLNFDLMLNPFNWVIVTLMLAIAALGVAFVFPSIAKKE